ncbi:hypothetical protein EYC80_007825 [Monilinia laxa]|uniref:Uncharacterized protein n=1 Tax=Monilinia laxa TaxID=61186 RepID=A0A5N6JSM7_MONLA|nr:hypothetical protein EYC80_007825 [Monilinia laxa]
MQLSSFQLVQLVVFKTLSDSLLAHLQISYVNVIHKIQALSRAQLLIVLFQTAGLWRSDSYRFILSVPHCNSLKLREPRAYFYLDIQRNQADNCTTLFPPIITGPVTLNGPTEISLSGSPTGIFTTIYPCGSPIPGPPGPPYYACPSGLNPTDPLSFGSLPTPTSIPSNPDSVVSSTDASIDPSGSSVPTPTDPSSPVTSDGSFPSATSSNSGTPVGPSSSQSSNGSFPSAGPSNLTDTFTPSCPTSSDGLFPSGSSLISTDPSQSAASSTYPGDPPSPSSTIRPSGANGNGGGPSYGYGYGEHYPSSTPTEGNPSNPSSSISVSPSATRPASSSSSSNEAPDISGGVSSSPLLSGNGSTLPSTTRAERSSSTASNGSENLFLSPSGIDPSLPSDTNHPPPFPPGYYGYGPPQPQHHLPPRQRLLFLHSPNLNHFNPLLPSVTPSSHPITSS